MQAHILVCVWICIDVLYCRCLCKYSNKCVCVLRGHSLVFRHYRVISTIFQQGCDQSPRLEMFTIPACVLNSRPDQATHIKGCFALPHILSLCRPLPLYCPLSLSIFFSAPALLDLPLLLSSMLNSCCDLNKTLLSALDIRQPKCFPYGIKIFVQMML